MCTICLRVRPSGLNNRKLFLLMLRHRFVQMVMMQQDAAVTGCISTAADDHGDGVLYHGQTQLQSSRKFNTSTKSCIIQDAMPLPASKPGKGENCNICFRKLIIL